MKRLELDYRRFRPASRLAAYALVATAAALTLEVGMRYGELQQNIATKEARLAARTSSHTRSMPAEVQPPVRIEEYAFARDTIRRLSVPWDALFQALEAAQTDGTALLSMEPDASNLALTITGEAKDYLGALTYVARLGQQDAVASARLARHEIRRGAGPRPVAFSVSATWKDNR